MDQLRVALDGLDAKVDRGILPLSEQHRRLTTIPGVGERAAEVILAEFGGEMSRIAP